LAEIAEQEDLFAQGLEDSRSVLKQIRNTESSVQPSRTHKQKVRTTLNVARKRGAVELTTYRSKTRSRS
jgi:phage shock protein A